MRINYNHLYYFWEVVRQGSLGRAAEQLHLTPQTVSGQLKQFQAHFSEPLLVRASKTLALTALGERVFEHADAMFAKQELLLALMEARMPHHQRRLRIGAADVLPKISVRRLLEPILRSPQPPVLTVREVELEDLLEDLARRRLDAVLSDRPIFMTGHTKVQSQLLLTSELAFYAADTLADQLQENFPHSLDAAPVLLPGPKNYVRRLLDQFFHDHGIKPKTVAEMEDSALVTSFGEAGFGCFAAPHDQKDVIEKQYRVRVLGRCEGVSEQFYAITLDARFVSPAVVEWLQEVKDFT